MVLKEFAKGILKSSVMGQRIYPLVQRIYRAWAIPLRQKRLQRHGYALLGRVHDVCERHNIPYFCDWGTLLGIVRENGFIKHDDDIDVTVYGTEVEPINVLKFLLDDGFSFIHALCRDRKIIEFTVGLYNLSVDFFFYEKTEDPNVVLAPDVYFDPKMTYPEPDLNNINYWKFPSNTSAIPYVFNGCNCMIPSNAESILKIEYGSNWRTPIANWKSTDAPGWFHSEDLIRRVTDLKSIM